MENKMTEAALRHYTVVQSHRDGLYHALPHRDFQKAHTNDFHSEPVAQLFLYGVPPQAEKPLERLKNILAGPFRQSAASDQRGVASVMPTLVLGDTASLCSGTKSSDAEDGFSLGLEEMIQRAAPSSTMQGLALVFDVSRRKSLDINNPAFVAAVQKVTAPASLRR